MKRILILYSLIIVSNCISASKAALRSQELQPVILKEDQPSRVSLGRTYNNYKGSRVLASKKRTYPFLDQMEELLYPGRDFKKENPGKRLERLEIATFGAKQVGSIPERTGKLESEVESWQIANAQALSIVNSRTRPNTKEHAFKVEKQRREPNNQRRNASPVTNQQQFTAQQQQFIPYQAYPPPNQYALNQTPRTRRREIDYDYENYRTANPLIRSIGRKTIDALFSL